jgi:hypothetical protein
VSEPSYYDPLLHKKFGEEGRGREQRGGREEGKGELFKATIVGPSLPTTIPCYTRSWEVGGRAEGGQREEGRGRRAEGGEKDKTYNGSLFKSFKSVIKNPKMIIKIRVKTS